MIASSRILIGVFSGRIVPPVCAICIIRRGQIGCPAMSYAAKRVLFLGALLLTLATPASAHPVPFSFLDLQLTSRGIEASLVIHDFDLAHDLSVREADRFLNPAFLAEHAASIRSLLAARLQLTVDGTTSEPEWGVPEILRDRESVLFPIRYPSL